LAKVAVALSGGVDSSLAAWLLVQAGHEVLGLSLRLGHGPDRAVQAGARVASQLGIPHQVVDARDAFTTRVVEASAAEYARGRTPNPCVLCNAGVKLPLLWQAGAQAGCEALATGHYARRLDDAWGVCLAEAADPAKSQAYFLARVGNDLLGRLVFPLAELTKTRVRGLAREAGLVAAEEAESQDACFLPPGGWDELMARQGLTRSGCLEDETGQVVGRHNGLHRFTVGQRRGLGVALGRPLYVLALDGARAAVRIGPREGLLARGLLASQPLWHMPEELRSQLRVRIRYAHPGVDCRVSAEGAGLKVEFANPQRAVAPGQLAVFFQGSRVAGSAWIQEPLFSNQQDS
jgi:tRNA-specific 2-thiouridylase